MDFRPPTFWVPFAVRPAKRSSPRTSACPIFASCPPTRRAAAGRRSRKPLACSGGLGRRGQGLESARSRRCGFSTGMKWGFLPKDAKQVYLVVNADESEPGTFKDRVLLVGDPHLLVEGIAVVGLCLGLHACLPLHSRRVGQRGENPPGRHRRGLCRWLAGQATGERHRAVLARHHPSPRRWRLHLRRRNLAAQLA
jgi:hypothetical protein